MLRRAYFSLRCDESTLRSQQARSFADWGLDYEVATARLATALAEAQMGAYDERISFCSQHWIFFAALAERAAPSQLLEIGTFDAASTRVLAALFPTSQIVTCDLPDDSPLFAATYDRASPAKRAPFVARRSENLRGLANVRFIQADSFSLPAFGLGPFDAVWVDGSHDYPDVAWDACNAFHMTTSGAYILFDDVHLHPKARKRKLVPDFNDTIALLQRLEAEGLYRVGYILKRVTRADSADPVLRRHIAVTMKEPVPR